MSDTNDDAIPNSAMEEMRALYNRAYADTIRAAERRLHELREENKRLAAVEEEANTLKGEEAAVVYMWLATELGWAQGVNLELYEKFTVDKIYLTPLPRAGSAIIRHLRSVIAAKFDLEGQARSLVQRAESAEARVAGLESALRAVVENCDLSPGHYSALERSAIAGCRAVLSITCPKCHGDRQYCWTCGERESACGCVEADINIGVCDHCETPKEAVDA